MSAEAIDSRTQRLMAIGPRVGVLSYVLDLLHANSHDTAAALGIDREEAGRSLRALNRLRLLGVYPRIPGMHSERRDFRITPKGCRLAIVLASL